MNKMKMSLGLITFLWISAEVFASGEMGPTNTPTAPPTYNKPHINIYFPGRPPHQPPQQGYPPVIHRPPPGIMVYPPVRQPPPHINVYYPPIIKKPRPPKPIKPKYKPPIIRTQPPEKHINVYTPSKQMAPQPPKIKPPKKIEKPIHTPEVTLPTKLMHEGAPVLKSQRMLAVFAAGFFLPNNYLDFLGFNYFGGIDFGFFVPIFNFFPWDLFPPEFYPPEWGFLPPWFYPPGFIPPGFGFLPPEFYPPGFYPPGFYPPGYYPPGYYPPGFYNPGTLGQNAPGYNPYNPPGYYPPGKSTGSYPPSNTNIPNSVGGENPVTPPEYKPNSDLESSNGLEAQSALLNDKLLQSNFLWINAENGMVPEGAIVASTQNGIDHYYCRAQFQKVIYLGDLVRDDGCYLENSFITFRFKKYNAAVRAGGHEHDEAGTLVETSTDVETLSTGLQQSIDQNYPQQNWVLEKEGAVPDKAIVFKMKDNKPIYYCRGQFKDQPFYGALITKDGCYLETPLVTIRFKKYEVLVLP